MSRHAVPSPRRSRYSLTPAAPRCLSCLVCDRVRSLAQVEPLRPARTMEKACSLRNTAVCRSCTGANTYPRFQGLGGLHGATQGHPPGRNPPGVFPTGDPGDRARRLTRSCFSKTAPARQGCPDEARVRSCLRPALNNPASAPSCAGVRRIRCRDRGSLGNPNGQTNDRLRAGMNGGGPEGPGAGGAVVESPGPLR